MTTTMKTTRTMTSEAPGDGSDKDPDDDVSICPHAPMALARATDGEAPGDGSDKDLDDDVSVCTFCLTRTGRKRPRSEIPTGIPKMCWCAEWEPIIRKLHARAHVHNFWSVDGNNIRLLEPVVTRWAKQAKQAKQATQAKQAKRSHTKHHYPKILVRETLG